ncbi:PP0621 family protein [Noviherbaspirillum sp.]|uniref:PP0621 family protein n=1 Tax=Noviherbaspirillum sp. TaxID=1926288 RepID=UPI002FDFFEB0
MKVLIWVVLAAVVVLWLLYGKKKSLQTKAKPQEKPLMEGAEAMIECAYCKTHVPASESVAGPSGAVFCSEEHRRLGASPR